MESNNTRKPVYEVFYVRELGQSNDEQPDGKSKPKARWTKLGAAFRNSDDSLSLYLEALPLNFDGKLQLRTPYRRNE